MLDGKIRRNWKIDISAQTHVTGPVKKEAQGRQMQGHLICLNDHLWLHYIILKH